MPVLRFQQSHTAIHAPPLMQAEPHLQFESVNLPNSRLESWLVLSGAAGRDGKAIPADCPSALDPGRDGSGNRRLRRRSGGDPNAGSPAQRQTRILPSTRRSWAGRSAGRCAATRCAKTSACVRPGTSWSAAGGSAGYIFDSPARNSFNSPFEGFSRGPWRNSTRLCETGRLLRVSADGVERDELQIDATWVGCFFCDCDCDYVCRESRSCRC